MNSIARKHQESTTPRTVLELDVNNHAGVMSHIVGLFSRRAYNVEGILCMPVGSGKTSRIWLTVGEDSRLEQMIRQIEKLEDVLVVRRHGAGHGHAPGIGGTAPLQRRRNRREDRLHGPGRRRRLGRSGLGPGRRCGRGWRCGRRR